MATFTILVDCPNSASPKRLFNNLGNEIWREVHLCNECKKVLFSGISMECYGGQTYCIVFTLSSNGSIRNLEQKIIQKIDNFNSKYPSHRVTLGAHYDLSH